MAVTRLSASFSQILDRVADMLMDRANKTDVREEQQMFLDARGSLKGERPALMAEFEKQLRKLIDERIADRATPKADFSKVDASQLTLVETVSMDESVLQGNITRVVENLCHDELSVLNRGVGYLLGKPDLATDTNPLGPAVIVGAFSGAVGSLKADRKIKFQIMKDLNQAQLGEIATIYADLNKHLTRHNAVPGHAWSGGAHRAATSEKTPAKPPGRPPPPLPGASELDVMAMFKRMYGSATPSAAPQAPPFGGAPHAPFLRRHTAAGIRPRIRRWTATCRRSACRARRRACSRRCDRPRRVTCQARRSSRRPTSTRA